MGDRPAQSRVGDPVGRVDGGGQVATRDLVLALGPGLDAATGRGRWRVDGLVIAELEMEEGHVLERAPLAAEERVAADEVERAGDPAAVAGRP